MVYSAKSDITTISQFTRRKNIHINSSSDGALTDFQIKLIISYESAMQADFDDIRFAEIDGSYINYWIESKTDSTTATIWIKTNVPASGGKDIYIYYGNSSLSNNSDGRNTFIVYDRYENVTEQWTESDPNNRIEIDRTTDNRVEITDIGDMDNNTYVYLDKGSDIGDFIYKTSVEVTAIAAYSNIIPMGISDTIGSPFSGWNDGVEVFFYSGTRLYIWVFNEGTGYSSHSNFAFSLNTIYYLSLIRAGSNFTVRVYSDYARTNQLTAVARPMGGVENLRYVYVTGQRLSGSSATRIASGNISETIIQKYTYNIPTTSIGTEQHQRKTPQFISK